MITPNNLRYALMDGDKEKYDELLNDLKIKQTVLKNQINTKIGVECTRLENLVNAVKDIFHSVILCGDILDLEIPDLKLEESAAQRRNQPG